MHVLLHHGTNLEPYNPKKEGNRDQLSNLAFVALDCVMLSQLSIDKLLF